MADIDARQRQDAELRKFRNDDDSYEVLQSIDKLRKRVNILTIINLVGYAAVVIAIYLK